MNPIGDPQDALQALLAGPSLRATLFPPNSRYAGAEVATIRRPDGETVVYVRRRLIPPPERFALMQEHVVVEGDRVDMLAARYLSDPELYWRLCDANAVLVPEELEEPGRVVRITLPEGIPGGNP